MINSDEINEILKFDFSSLQIDDICNQIEKLSQKNEIEIYKKLKKKYEQRIVEKIKIKVDEIKCKKKNEYFKEIFYCLYFKKSYKQCIYVILSSTLRNKIGTFEDDVFHIESIFFPRNVSRYFNSIKIHGFNQISYDLINDLDDFFTIELKKNDFIRTLPIVGNINTQKFKQYILSIENNIDPCIKKYIHKEDMKELAFIDSKLLSIKFHLSASKKFKSFYLDSMDAFSAYMSAKSGNPRKYKSYYSISGHRFPID